MSEYGTLGFLRPAIVLSLMLVGAPHMVVADGVDEALGIEELTDGGIDRAVEDLRPEVSGVMTEAAEYDDSAMVVLPEGAAEPGEATGDGKGQAVSISVLADALQKKEQELSAAKEEIARLRGMVRKIWEANRREQLTMHYNLGCVYKVRKMYKRAEAEFLKAIEIDPLDADAHYNLAILYDDDLKDRKKAKRHYEQFLKLAPDDRDAAKVYEWLSSIQ